jgi:peroxiredoxin
MNTTHSVKGLIPALLLLLSTTSEAVEVKLEFLPQDAMPKMGGYRPQKAPTFALQPASISQTPPDIADAEFGEIKLGPADSQRTFAFVIDRPESDKPRLFVDSNANGDLTDDPPAIWSIRRYTQQDGSVSVQTSGSFMLDLKWGEETARAQISAYRFDSKDPKRPHNVLLYYTNYARVGSVTLGDKAIPALLADDDCKGDFSAPTSSFRLDINGDGKFSFQGERFFVKNAFNIGGTTYEISGLTPSGSSFQVVKSSRTVAESKPQVVLMAGQQAPPFEATTLAGEKISLPGSYKGKVVLLDFWATWCGPCIGELPNVIAAYEKHHASGLEILGISLDSDSSKEKLPAFIQEKRIQWPQVCDGLGWKAAIGQLYNVHSIPATFLIDGDSGKVIAVGIRGAALEPAIAKALAEKAR